MVWRRISTLDAHVRRARLAAPAVPVTFSSRGKNTMNAMWRNRGVLVLLPTLLAAAVIATSVTPPPGAVAGAGGPGELAGKVQIAGNPVVGAAVTLYAAGDGQPTQLAQEKTGADGTFKLGAGTDTLKGPADKVYYLVARGGAPQAAAGKGPNDAVALLAVLGTAPPKNVTVNELTTVASAFCAARFINGESISGKPLGLRIAAGNVPNLVDPTTGGWGKVLVGPVNDTYSTTLANLNTLGSLVAAFATVANDDWRARFLKAATLPGGTAPKNTLEAMAGIARRPWAEAKTLYGLFDETYPQPKDGARRQAPFVPYLAYPPPDFVLSLWFGGSYSLGNVCFDAEGNAWSGQNWMAGSQSGVVKSIGGGTIKFSPNGTVVSPPITGYTGMGVDGIGWGTGVTQDRVWVANFNGKIGVMDFQGKPVGKASDFPFKEKLSNLMGVGIAANGDVWIAESPDNELLYFPGGRIKDGRIVKVAGLHAPFGIAIDAQNRVWVSNSQFDTVLRFRADDPSKVESFRIGLGGRGVALDSKGNLWVASLMSPGFPPPKIPEGLTIMEQFKILGEVLAPYAADNPKKTTGVASMIRPDGTQPAPKGYDGGGAINCPWGMAIDGNDDVWVASGLGRSVVLLAGAEPKGHAPGTKTGDLIHNFQLGTIQIPTVGAVDPAGNVWVANNWNDFGVASGLEPSARKSTWGGGSGMTVIYGVAAPVKTPLMGQVRQP
jgi:hypothetical protein